jgi:hexameric tyrosine-coordinated heme protein (HTHP)
MTVHGTEPAAEPWLPTLATPTPQAGFELAIKLALRVVQATQPNPAIRMALRESYANNSTELIAASQVVGTYFQTVAAANDYWRAATG